MTDTRTSSGATIMERGIARLVTTPPPAPGFIGEGHTAVPVLDPRDFARNDPFIVLMDDRIFDDQREAIGRTLPLLDLLASLTPEQARHVEGVLLHAASSERSYADRKDRLYGSPERCLANAEMLNTAAQLFELVGRES